MNEMNNENIIRTIIFSLSVALTQRNEFFELLAIECCNSIYNVDDRYVAATSNCIPQFCYHLFFEPLPAVKVLKTYSRLNTLNPLTKESSSVYLSIGFVKIVILKTMIHAFI